MYTLIKARVASMFELYEYYTLDEALLLYSLYEMDRDIESAKMKEVSE